jgi:hypothetical protein
MNDRETPLDRLTGAVARIAVAVGDRAMDALDDRTLLQLVRDAASARNALDLVVAQASAVVDLRSTRERGADGLAQREGHRNGTSLLQTLTGQTRTDVVRAVRTGGVLIAPVGSAPSVEPESESVDAWRNALHRALSDGRLSQAQFHAISVGLGEPPLERYPDEIRRILPAAWLRAIEILLDDAAELPVEELRAAARIARDRLDPAGVTLRFEERFAARSYRSWTDESGQRHARIDYDDEAAAFVDALLQAALRPRRGPRFVDDSASASDGDAPSDDRTNDQLSYDTLVAVLRTGAMADPTQAFGDRQPGVRLVVEATAIAHVGAARVVGVGHAEDGGAALPGGVIEARMCDAGTVRVTLDGHGRPLDVGRTQRLFTPAQRIAIAVRDGGCIGQGCTAPISQCEFHHIISFAHGGRTDVDDGVPLCRNHHLGLHNRGQRIVRDRDPVTGDDRYWLHSPPDPHTGELRPPVLLRTRTPRRFEAA